MAKKQTDREKVEAVFSNPLLSETEARHLLDVSGVIVRSRFPSLVPVKRRKAKVTKLVPPQEDMAPEVSER